MSARSSTSPQHAVFERCYRAHRAEVYRWALRYGVGRSAWAEDLTHDVFVRLHAHLEHLDAEATLGPWLYRTTANLALNRLRDEKSVLGRLSTMFRGSERDEMPSPEARLSRRQALLKTLAKLPAKEHVVMCMKVLDGKEQQEIAQTLGLSEGYVSKVAARAWALIERSGWEGSHEAR
jgi:RNA polymerase sigma-70 factor (ECF subfamily)